MSLVYTFTCVCDDPECDGAEHVTTPRPVSQGHAKRELLRQGWTYSAQGWRCPDQHTSAR